MEQKWDSVILIGKQALRQDIDYYYLRVRIGISYFEKRSYYPAVTHLKKACNFNTTDPVAANYLYYAYKYTSQNEEASLVKSKMSPEARKLVEHDANFLEFVHAETGFTFSSNKNPGNLSTLMEDDSIYGEQDLYGDNFYGEFGLKLRLSNRLSLIFGYNYLNFDKTKYIQYGRFEAQVASVTDTSWGKNYNYNFPWVIHDTSFNYQVKQHEFYINATMATGSGFKIMPAFHYIHDAYTTTSVSYRFDTVQLPAYYTSSDDSIHTYPFEQLNYSFQQKDTTFGNYVASLKVTKNLGIFNLGLAGSFSNINGRKQKQAEISLTYFPLGNMNFYGTTTAAGFFQQKDKRLLISQVLGCKITSWLWAEGNFYYGDYTNANIFNGSIVYNSSDVINYKAGALLIFVISQHLHVNLIYQHVQKESKQYYYIKEQDPVTNEINEVQTSKYNPYFTNSIFGGITWKL
jgi:hypothetical protein